MITRHTDKSTIRRVLMEQAEESGHPISFCRAGKLAERIRRGDDPATILHNPDKFRSITYRDDTGNVAARNADHSRWCTRSPLTGECAFPTYHTDQH